MTHTPRQTPFFNVISLLIISAVLGYFVSGKDTSSETQDFHYLRHIFKRESSVPRMQNAYKKFYTRLTKFAKEMPGRLKPDAPKALSSSVVAITKLLSSEDTPFTHHDIKDIIKWAQLTFKATGMLLEKLDKCKYIKPDKASQKWFRMEKTKLGFTMSISKVILKTLKSDSGVLEVSSGAGGGNQGIGLRHTIPTTVLVKIKELASLPSC